MPGSDQPVPWRLRSCNSARPRDFRRFGNICSSKLTREGTAGPDDDILITSGCQQALDLLQRVLAPAGLDGRD